MSTDVVVDALPYFDSGYEEPGVRDTSLAMVEEECRRYRPTKNYLEHLPPINTATFETELMRNEFERIQNRLPMEPLSMKRYELPPPPPSKISELSAWQDSVENSMAQLEHQAVRAMNLELMLDYGCETWKVYLDVITSMLSRAQTQLEAIKQEILDINWQRKDTQSEAGVKLRALETQWVMLVSKNYEIEQVCAKMEEEIAQIKMQQAKLNGTEVENDDSNDNEAEASNNDQSMNDEPSAQPDGNEPENENSIENGHQHDSASEQQEPTDLTTMDQTDQ